MFAVLLNNNKARRYQNIFGHSLNFQFLRKFYPFNNLQIPVNSNEAKLSKW